MRTKLTPTKAKAELQLWQQQGKNLLALVKLQHSKPGFSLYIPGYRCNNWYRLGKQYYPSQQAALAAYGELLDSLANNTSKPQPLKAATRLSQLSAAASIRVLSE
uniref:hypothetical protein n=1 Tax=Rheinheimera sp. TaxID=1869214 RepID=UPI004048DDF3